MTVRYPVVLNGTTIQELQVGDTLGGLENVDNTSDLNKPVSTATQTALNLKLDKAGGTITGAVNLGYNPLNEVKLNDYSELVGTATASPANVITLSPANGNIQTYTLPANTTINPDTSAETINNGGRSISLFLSTGVTPYSVTFSASFKFTNTLPTFVASKTYEFSLRYVNATIGWVCVYCGAV